jgi:hypothetical protein
MRQVLGIGAIESVFDDDHKFKKYSSTFVNNLLTYRKDHKKTESVQIIDCRGHVDADNPIESMVCDIESRGPIDSLIFSCHSDSCGLYIFSKTRRELSESARYLYEEFDWKRFKFTPHGIIRLWGCNTGRGKESIAQIIADKTGVPVYAFTSRSSQRKRPDGGFVQVPDNKKTVIFEGRQDRFGGDHIGARPGAEKNSVVLRSVCLYDSSFEMEQGLSLEDFYRDQDADQEPKI